MKCFLYTILRNVAFFLTLACCAFMIDAMDVIETSEARFLKKLEVFNNHELVNAGKKWSESVPQAILITPDEKGILIAMYGRVLYGDVRTMVKSKLHELIRHSHQKYCPMIAAAMTKNGLRVVSVLNNTSDAECIISRNHISNHPDHKSHNVFKKSLREDRRLEAPAQAIALSGDGDIIAIAFKDHIGIIDLLTGTHRRSNFMPYLQGALVTAISAPVDVEFGPCEKHVAAASTEGVIDVKRINKTEEDGITLTHFKDINTGENSIEKIHLNAQQLLYVTKKCEAKIVDVKDWIEHAHGAVKTRTITHCHQCKVAADLAFNEGTPLGTVEWSDCQHVSEDKRYKITIRREHGTAAEKLVISLSHFSHLEKKYNSITETGQEKSELTHVLLAALRGNCVAALVTDGCLYFWQLPEKYMVPTEEDVARLSQAQYYHDKLTRRRSNSSPVSPSLDEMQKNEKRKSDKKPGFGSRISLVNPARSKESIKVGSSKAGSPTPRRSKKTVEVVKEPVQEADYIKALIDDINHEFDQKEKD